MWEKGNQPLRLDYSSKINEELLSLEGTIDENEAKERLYLFLRNNITYSAEMFTGVKLFPFQAMAIKTMMVADYSMMVWSRGLSKTFSTAMLIILMCLFKKGANIGVVGPSFRQSKNVFQKIEDILRKPEAILTKACGYKLQKGTDQWILTLGAGTAKALPLATGDKLRGSRFNIMVLDEFLAIPEKIFNEVITPFLSVVENPTERDELEKLENLLIEQGDMKPSERYVWPNNKLILLSSPSYKFEYMYKLYRQYIDLIFRGSDEKRNLLSDEKFGEEPENAYRAIMQLSYDCAPKALYDRNLLKQAKETMSEQQFNREFSAQFIDESDGYFRMSKMIACTVPDGGFPAVELVGDPTDEYILAFDPSWSGNASSDHFAIQIFKLDKDNQTICLVHSYAIAGLDLKDHINYFHYLLTHFNIVGICGDYNGGLIFIDACNESELFNNSKIKIKQLDGVFDKPEEYQEDLALFKQSYNKSDRKFCFLRKPTGTWIRTGNELLQGAIDHKRVLFGARAIDSHFSSQIQKDFPINKLTWDSGASDDWGSGDIKKSKKIDLIDCLKQNVEMTKAQCASIEVLSNPQGSQTFALPAHLRKLTSPNRARKDSYSALVLGNWFGKVYFDSINLQEGAKVESTFKPFTI